MAANYRLTIAIHTLSWMANIKRRDPEPVTSDRIAGSVKTNPVVIRQLLGRMKKCGLVISHRGQNAGWTLAKEASTITLRDVYDAVEKGPLFALHHTTPNQACPVGRGIRPVLGVVYSELESTLMDGLSATTIEQVLSESIRR